MNKHCRAINTEQGRTTLALESETWQAVDLLARIDPATNGDWQAWCKARIKPEGESRTKQVRAAVIRALSQPLLAAQIAA